MPDCRMRLSRYSNGLYIVKSCFYTLKRGDGIPLNKAYINIKINRRTIYVYSIVNLPALV